MSIFENSLPVVPNFEPLVSNSAFLLQKSGLYYRNIFWGGMSLMDMKVGIVDSDQSFVKRFCAIMNSKFDDLEIFVFPTLKQAQTAAKKSILHLLLVDSSILSKSSYNNLIPLQCKVVVLTNEKTTVENGQLPSVCKYKSVDEWYVLICQFCSGEPLLYQKGGEAKSQRQNKTCLFIPGGVSTTGASVAASEFSHFLYKEGMDVAVLEPFIESGEFIWKIVEGMESICKVISICLSEFDDDSIVIPFINADVVVFVSNGNSNENEGIEMLLHKLPSLCSLSKEEVCEKSYLLYSQFDEISGTYLQTDEIGKLGGLDNEKNSLAAFEKLVTILNV